MQELKNRSLKLIAISKLYKYVNEVSQTLTMSHVALN